MAFIDFFYSKKRMDQYEAELNGAEALSDPAVRLLRYAELSKATPARMWSGIASALVIGALAVAVVTIIAAIPFAVAAGAASGGALMNIAMALSTVSLTGSATVFASFVVLGVFKGRAGKLLNRAQQAKDTAEAAASLDAFAPSPQFDAVLTAVPSLKARFGEEALQSVRTQSVSPASPKAPAAPGA